MNLSALAGILGTLIGIIYTIQAYMLPQATVGNPLGPKVMPLGLGVLMILLGIILTIQEIKKEGFIKKGSSSKKEDNVKLIVYTCGICILYALLFNRIGYVLATIIFLELVLFLFNGKEKWKSNTMIAICFSVTIYILFSKFLGITLPVMPFIYI